MFIRVETPFAGFYQSYYDSELEYADEIVGEEEAKRIDEALDIQKFQNTIAEKYVEFLNDRIEDIYKVPNLLSEPTVHPMTLRNTEDDITALISVALIPSLEELQEMSSAVLDFKQQLIQIAKDKLTSRDGFISFYSPDIESLFDKPYTQWEFAYLTCLLGAMVATIGCDEGLHDHTLDEWQAAHYDLELNAFAQDYLQKTGGVLDIALGSLKED